MPIQYPATPKSGTVDDYHGTPVADPYRWLVEAQNQLTRDNLDQNPALEKIKARLAELWNFPKYETIKKSGGKYYFTQNYGLQNQAVLYVQDTLDAEPRPLLDPNTLSDDGTVALMEQTYSPDGNLLAYTLAASGSDWQEIHILDTTRGEKETDILQWNKSPTIAWKSDQSGFFYNRLPKPGTVPIDEQNQHVKVYFHSLGTPQSSDTLIFENSADKTLRFYPHATDSGDYLYLFTMRGTDRRNGIYLRPMESDGDFQHLVEDGEAKFIYVGNDGTMFYFHTDLDAPRGRVIAIDLDKPGREHWAEIIPEGDDTIEEVKLINDRFVLFLKHHAHSKLSLHKLDGDYLRDVPLPAMGTATYLSGGQNDQELFFSFESFLYPKTILHYNFEKVQLSTFQEAALDFDLDSYETIQAFYPSKDGTHIPVFLTHRKELKKDGNNPTILYGYGGFTISQTPFFNVWNLVWLEMGGVFALANIRGGDEYGEEWHKAGVKLQKQNVFDDFIAAAEMLIDEGYTTPDHLGSNGGSNGGLLVAAAMTQRPDLFRAVLCTYPDLDMVRFYAFQETNNMPALLEYGDSRIPEHFDVIRQYSPYQAVRDGADYPAVMLATGDLDTRVPPLQARRMTARLQAATASGLPVILWYDARGGHAAGRGRPMTLRIEDTARELTFMAQQLGLEAPN